MSVASSPNHRLFRPAMSYFPPCTIDGCIIDLVHLEPFAFSFVAKTLGRVLTVDVKFSNHCYTTTFDPALHDRPHMVMDHKVERAFDQVRYNLSRKLPEIIRGLPNYPVWLTASDRNFVFVANVEDQQGGSYPVFFHLRRLMDEAPQNLSMVIERAYPVEDRNAVLGGATKISFPVLCAKIFRGEKVKPHARR